MTKEHRRVGQVGCIDGSVLEVRQGSDEWILSVGDSEARLSCPGSRPARQPSHGGTFSVRSGLVVGTGPSGAAAG